MDSSPISVIYVEDDERLAALTAQYLERHNVTVTRVERGDDALAATLRERPDIVLLDLMLPGKDGFEVCRQLRAHVDTPIVMVTARGLEDDRVRGLEEGADDYLSKPFSPRELLARIRSHVRRNRGLAGPAKTKVHVGSLELDMASFSALWRGKPLSLTNYEFNLIKILAERAGRVLSRELLLELARGNAEEAFDRSIDGHISRIRHKLGDDSRNPRVLKTIRGAGYMLLPHEA